MCHLSNQFSVSFCLEHVYFVNRFYVDLFILYLVYNTAMVCQNVAYCLVNLYDRTVNMV